MIAQKCRFSSVDDLLRNDYLSQPFTVLLMPASGNHDPAHFPDAETMDIRRRNAREHLTFGKQRQDGCARRCGRYCRPVGMRGLPAPVRPRPW